MRLRYWLRTGGMTFAIVLGASAIYALLMVLQMSDGLDAVLNLLPLYLLLFGSVMLAAMNLAVYKFNLSLAISFGSTRSEAMLGLNLNRLLPTVLLTAVLAVLCALAGEDGFLSAGAAIPVGLGLYLLLSALGSIGGMVFYRFGKIVAVVVTVVIMLAAMSAGGLMAFSGGNGSLFSVGHTLRWAILALGLVVYGVVLIPERRIVRTCNVKL